MSFVFQQENSIVRACLPYKLLHNKLLSLECCQTV